MTPPANATPSAPHVSRFTGFILGFIVFICISMIGLAGFLKFELDRAQADLTAPAQLVAPDEESFEKFRRNLGYSGFIGMAQNYATVHDGSNVPAMQSLLKQASETVSKMSDRTLPETRRDLQSILAVFDEAMKKIEKSAGDPTTGFTQSDMAALYAALPILDARVASAAASNRIGAQSKMQMWATLLTLVSWASLILAAALAAGIYLTMRDRNSTPLRAMVQSVKNMARGDMRTSIWGMERQDTLGELARALDMARFQFSQLPDMALLSEQGPVRIRFEGNTRSLFEAMMRVISRDSEQVHAQTTNLTEAISRQEQTITALTNKVEHVIGSVQGFATEGDQQVRSALNNILTSANNLKASQEHAADQLNRIVPYMQERAQGLAEITQIAGKEVAQVLQSLMLSGRNLRINADEGDATIKKLAATADSLGERLFGAVNLLQASGKVLAETTEVTRSRLEEAIERLNLKNLSAACFTSDMPQTDPVSDTVNYLRDEIGSIGAAIGHIISRVDELATRPVAIAPAEITAPPIDLSPRLEELSAMIKQMPEKITDGLPRIDNSNMLLEIKAGFELMARSLERTREQMRAVAMGGATDGNVSSQVRDQWGQMAGQIEANRAAIEQTISQHISRLEERFASMPVAAVELTNAVQPEALRDAQQQMEQQTQILTELVATLGALDAHMQDISQQVSGIRSKAS